MKSKALKKRAVEVAPFWDAKKEKAVEFLLKGQSKIDVARQVGCDRKTLRAWMGNPEFAQRLADAARDRFETTRARRVWQQTEFADQAADLVQAAFDKAKKNPKDRMAKMEARAWGAEFRAWRDQERVDWGEKSSKVEVSVSGSVSTRTTHEISFKSFLAQKLDEGVIDVEALPADDPAKAVAGLLKEALIADPSLIDAIHEEDRARAQEER